MDDAVAVAVRGFEGFGDLPRDAERLVQRQGALGEPLGQGRALDQLHDEATVAVRLCQAVNVRDIGVVERGQNLGLALEAGQPVLIGCHGGRQDLQGHLTLQLGVAGPIDLAHTARAEMADDLVGSEAGAGSQRHAAPPFYVQ